MPKRGAIALALTTLALILLFSFKTPDTGTLSVGRNVALVAPVVTSAPASAGAATAAGGAASPPTSDASPAASPASQAAGSAPTATAAPAASPAPAAGSGGTPLANGTVTGPVVQTQFGPVQVQVTIANGKITDVTALQLPSDRQRSAYISGIVGPMLQGEALTAQSAQIDLISGATYTSDAYAQSLQAALDQAAHG
jgi:uncharacterized protein with FMN-binding domain